MAFYGHMGVPNVKQTTASEDTGLPGAWEEPRGAQPRKGWETETPGLWRTGASGWVLPAPALEPGQGRLEKGPRLHTMRSQRSWPPLAPHARLHTTRRDLLEDSLASQVEFRPASLGPP